MHRKIFAAAALAALALIFSLQPPCGGQQDPLLKPDNALKQKLDQLVAKLGSDDFNERQAAGDALLEWGEYARGSLEAAANNPDPEVKKAAEQILDKIKMLDLTIVCVDADGKPIKNANTVVTIENIKEIREEGAPFVPSVEVKKAVVTDENGAFRVEPFEGKIIKIDVTVENYAQMVTGLFIYQGGRHTNVFRFVPLGTVRGVVLDSSKNDAPVQFSEVKIGDRSTITDEKGRFEMKNVAPGEFDIVIFYLTEENGRLMTTRRVILKPGGAVETTVKVSTKIPQPLIEESKKPSLKLTLLKPDGAPLANAPVDVTAKIIPQKPVSFQTASHSTSAVRLTTGEDGSLALKLREAGKYQISISIVGCVPVNLGEFDLKEGETLEIKEPVKLDKGLAVDALVKDSAGKPVENAVVIAQPVARGKRVVSSTSFLAQEWGTAATDARGAAKIEGLEAGETALRAVASGCLASECKQITLKKGENAKIEFTLFRPPTATVEVLDAATNQPVADASIINLPALKPGEDEIISIRADGTTRELEPGRRFVVATASGYQPGYFAADLKAEESVKGVIRLVKTGSGALRGKIEASPAAPMSSVSAAILYPIGAPARLGQNTSGVVLRIYPDGTFAAADLRAGLWGIVLKNADDVMVANVVVDVAPDKTAEVSLKIKPLGKFEVTLLDSDGKPKAEKNLSLIFGNYPDSFQFSTAPRFQRLRYYYPLSAETDAQGKCLFGPLPEGDWRLISGVAYSDYTLSGQVYDARVEAGKTTQATFKLARTTTVEGKVTGPPAELSFVLLMPDTEDFFELVVRMPSVSVQVQSDGSFKITDVPPGHYRVIVLIESNLPKSTFSTTVNVQEGVPLVGVEVETPKSYRRFSGKVLDYALKDGDRSYVLLYGRCQAGAIIAPDGSFEGAAPPGKYKAYCVPSTRIGNGLKVKMNPVEIVIEEGKDLSGIEIPQASLQGE